jgi:hypothetical protein
VERKTGIEILPVAFTDHDALVLRLSVPNLEARRRRGRLKTDPALVTEERTRDKILIEWTKWLGSRHCYSDEEK